MEWDVGIEFWWRGKYLSSAGGAEESRRGIRRGREEKRERERRGGGQGQREGTGKGRKKRWIRENSWKQKIEDTNAY